MERMHEAGVYGIPLNLVNRAVLGVDHALHLCRRVAPSGWHQDVQLALGQADARDILRDLLLASPVALVIDHIERASTEAASNTLSEARVADRHRILVVNPAPLYGLPLNAPEETTCRKHGSAA
jgi:hypothetical protein